MNAEISKQFASYEIAVKLKELGFNEPCFATYNKLNNGKIDLLPKKFGVNEMTSLVSAYLWQQSISFLNLEMMNEDIDFIIRPDFTSLEYLNKDVLKAIELIEKQK